MSKYIYDDDGQIIKIEDDSIKESIGEEEYSKWQKYNEDRVRDGYSPLLYEEYQRDINNCRKIVTKERELKTIEKKRQIEFERSKDDFHKFICDNLGVFYFSVYNSLLKVDLEPQFRFRFIYLCTYLNYNNKLEYGNTKKGYRLMLERDLEEVLGLSRMETFKTKKALINANLITIEEDKTISVNKKYCVKGKIGKRDLKKGSIRIMMEGIQKLYESVSVKEHKKLALFIEILPYVNFNHNIVCSNPNESNVENIEPISITNLAKMMGYSTTQKLKKGLMDIKIDGKSLIMIATIDNKNMIVVNPLLYYKGNNIEALRGIINLFKIANRK